MYYVMTAVADSLKVILIQSKVGPFLIGYNVMHQCSPAYLPRLLPALLAFIVISAQDVRTHLLPGRRVIEPQLLFSCHCHQTKGRTEQPAPEHERDT